LMMSCSSFPQHIQDLMHKPCASCWTLPDISVCWQTIPIQQGRRFTSVSAQEAPSSLQQRTVPEAIPAAGSQQPVQQQL
jgi:hypothetical protein